MSTADEKNALALAETMHAFHEESDARFRALENEVKTLKELVQKQSQTIGIAIQRLWGTGSTERHDGDLH